MSDPGSMSDNGVSKKEESEMDDSSVVAEDPCPVCLSSRKSESEIDGCAHTFCYSCITEWLKVSESCPLCKAPVTEVRTKVDGKSVVKKISELKAKAEAERIMAQANEVPMTTEREAVTQVIHQQRVEVQQIIASKAMNRKNKKLNERYKQETSKLTQYTALRDEMERLPRREMMGDSRFREVVYRLQLVWKEITRPATTIRFNTNMACSDPDGLMQRLRPFLMRELKIVMIDKRKLSEEVLNKILTAIQNYNINNPDFETVLFTSGLFHPMYIVRFAHLLYQFCASGLELEAFDANSTYSLNPERAPSGNLIPSLLPVSSRTSGPIVLNDDDDDDGDDEPEVVDQFRAMSDSSSSDGVHEIYNHRACVLPPPIRNPYPISSRDTRTLGERMAAYFPNSSIFSNMRGLPSASSLLPARNIRAPEVISIDDESNTRDEARINSIHRRERESGMAEPSWLNVTGQDRPSTSRGIVPFGSRLTPLFSIPDIGNGIGRSEGEGSSWRRDRDRDRDNRNGDREIETSWRAENGRKAESKKDKRGQKEEKERRRDYIFMGVRNGSRKNNAQHYYDKLHYEVMSEADLEKLSGELSTFSERIDQLKKMCDKRIAEKRKTGGASSSNESSQNRKMSVVDVDDDDINMQEDQPGPSNTTQDDSVVIL